MSSKEDRIRRVLETLDSNRSYDALTLALDANQTAQQARGLFEDLGVLQVAVMTDQAAKVILSDLRHLRPYLNRLIEIDDAQEAL